MLNFNFQNPPKINFGENKLTIPATGSESSGNSVVTRNGNKLPFNSPLVRPLFVVLDPSVTLSLPDRQISNGVVDAFIHTIERY